MEEKKEQKERMRRFADFINKQNIRAYLAMGVVVFGLSYMLFVSYHPVPVSNREITILCLGYIIGLVSSVIAYYFGANKKVDEDQKQNA
jgi:hypothetical protein